VGSVAAELQSATPWSLREIKEGPLPSQTGKLHLALLDVPGANQPVVVGCGLDSECESREPFCKMSFAVDGNDVLYDGDSQHGQLSIWAKEGHVFLDGDSGHVSVDGAWLRLAP
jgi:hypothetical protein